MSKPTNPNTLTYNKKANFEYHILDTFLAGLALSTPSVKGIRAKELNPDGAYIVWQNNRLEIISRAKENIPLLLKKDEMSKIKKALKDKGITCILLNFKKVGRWIKADIALAKGKNIHDKKETLKQKDLKREEERGQS
jgi:SsrA-binding protein